MVIDNSGEKLGLWVGFLEVGVFLNSMFVMRADWLCHLAHGYALC